MEAALLFLCIGFMIAVLYIDLSFDVSALPFRGRPEPLPTATLKTIEAYYRRIASNPYPLMLVMATAVACLVTQTYYGWVPRWIGYASLGLMAAIILFAIGKVIPTANGLASKSTPIEERRGKVEALLTYHFALLISVLALAGVQLVALVTS
ncbi:MAG: conserved hypothetical rane protein [Alphaproteobacteria bacterium]|nr:conserved hypothetical rane protein [Alphaproteobacteria bacterium]